MKPFTKLFDNVAASDSTVLKNCVKFGENLRTITQSGVRKIRHSLSIALDFCSFPFEFSARMSSFSREQFESTFIHAKPTQTILANRQLNPIASTILAGCYDDKSPLSRLRYQDDVLRIIWRMVVQLNVTNHRPCPLCVGVGRDLNDDVLDDITVLDNMHLTRSEKTANECHRCGHIDYLGVANLDRTVCFPKPSGICVLDLPFIIGSIESIPEGYRQYWPIINAFDGMRGTPTSSVTRDHAWKEIGCIGYLSIQEGPVKQSSRQSRVSDEHAFRGGGGIRCQLRTGSKPSQSRKTKLTSGYKMQSRYPRYGEKGCRGGTGAEFVGGTYMACNVPDWGVAWDAQVLSQIINEHGDIAALPRDMGIPPTSLHANTLYWVTETTPIQRFSMESSYWERNQQHITVKVTISKSRKP